MALSHLDVKRLETEKSPEARADIARKICADYQAGAFNPQEAELARTILRLLVHDIEIRVRAAIAEGLKHSLNAPHDVIRALAEDKIAVAIPVLRYSAVLSEDDLIEIVNSTQEIAKLMAIAMRDSISSELSGTLVNTRDARIIRLLVENGSASMTEDQLESLLKMHRDDYSVLEALTRRGGLPACIAEKLVTMVSDSYRDELIRTHRLPFKLSDAVAQQARERTTVDLIAGTVSPVEIRRLVNQLAKENKLTHSLVLYALCIGNVTFFEEAMSRLAKIPVANARILIRDKGAQAFSSLYKIAKMPDGLYQATQFILQCALKVTHEGFVFRNDYTQRALEHILASEYAMKIDNMPYLVTIMTDALRKKNAVH